MICCCKRSKIGTCGGIKFVIFEDGGGGGCCSCSCSCSCCCTCACCDGDPIIIGDVTLEELKANDLLILPFKLDIELIEFLGDKDCEFLDKLRGRNDCTE